MHIPKLSQIVQKRSFKLIFFVLLTFFLTMSLVRNIQMIRLANKKIGAAEERLNEIANKNKELVEQLQNIESPVYQEKQLRDKLGFAKEGEIVLVLPEEDVVRKFAPKEVVEEAILPDPNWKKWLNLFI